MVSLAQGGLAYLYISIGSLSQHLQRTTTLKLPRLHRSPHAVDDRCYRFFFFPKLSFQLCLSALDTRFLPSPIPCFFGVASGLFSVLVEDSGLASTILFSVIGFLGEVSLALSTDIIFPYRHILLSNRNR